MADSPTRQKQPLEFPRDLQIPYESLRSLDDTFSEAYEIQVQYNPSSDDLGLVSDSSDPSEVYPRLNFLYGELQRFSFDVLLQFWSTVNIGRRCVLATYNQPFAINLDSGYQEYRLRSFEYKYNIDPINNNNNNNLEGEEDPLIINGAPVINVFRSHLAELILDLRVHQGSPLVSCALEYGLMSCLLIPICDASQSRCVGVLECCAKEFESLLQTSSYLLHFLKIVGLRMFKVQKDLLYKTIGGLECTEDEIRVALDMACKSLPLMLAQVSIVYEDEDLVKRLVAHTLTTQTSTREGLITDYCDVVDMLPIIIMEGLVVKALENYELHSVTMTKFSCLVICLRSSLKGDHVDYVFEFLWPREHCYRTMIKRLISTLKLCLPNFKFACGEELGDEFRVIDIGNFSRNEVQTTLEYFEGEKSSPIPKASEEKKGKGKTYPISLTLHQIEKQYGRTMEEAATNLNVSKSTLKRKWREIGKGSWRGPKWGKRKVNNSSKDQNDMNEDTLTIKAKYENDFIKFRRPLSLITFEAVEKEIGKKLKLNPESFKLKYLDEDAEPILLESDDDIKLCIESSGRVNCNTIKLYVQPK